jgi:hypothetical protein
MPLQQAPLLLHVLLKLLLPKRKLPVTKLTASFAKVCASNQPIQI